MSAYHTPSAETNPPELEPMQRSSFDAGYLRLAPDNGTREGAARLSRLIPVKIATQVNDQPGKTPWKREIEFSAGRPWLIKRP